MDLQYFDIDLDVAVGRNRQDISWRNVSTTWGEFLDRLVTPKRTPETVREWEAMSKQARGERKDVGGFVGGFVADGRRKKGNITFRSMLTLDIDFGTPETWRTIADALTGYALAVYSTHSHTEAKPRYRLLLPLTRTVSADEYEAVARWTAGRVGIDLFDDSTFEPERLMYWPACSIDAPYFFRHLDGDGLDPDVVLASYTDWRDTSSWPISSRVSEVVRRSVAKLGDPEDKPGIVGAFCRTYSIREAIETFLADVYEPSERHPDRYTYTAGTTKEGLVIYEDKWAYSNHGTDPIMGREVNAFDLVRVHRYGLKDEGCHESTPINKRPSFLAMEDWARQDKGVRATINRERMAAAAMAFGDEGVEEVTPGATSAAPGKQRAANIAPVAADDLAWMEGLEMDKKSNYISSLPNLSLIIENARELRGRLIYDEFRGRCMVTAPLPWDRPEETYPRQWGDTDDNCLQVWLSRDPWGVTGKDKVLTAFSEVLNRKHVHPVRAYFAGLPAWDGVRRLDTLVIDYLGAEDSPLNRAMTRKTMAAAAARIMQPGIKFDYMLTLIGPEGIGKSRLLAALAVRPEWFSDSLTTIEGKEAMEQVSGKWIIEVGELSNYKRSTVEAYKAFISKQTDSFRAAFARRTEDRPRQCVFVATTNEDTPLKGDTGNRRFWVMDVGAAHARKDIGELQGDLLAQVWAEALQAYREGEPLYLEKALEEQARARQAEKNELAGDDRMGLIETYLRTLLPNDWEARSPESRRAFFAVADPIDRCGNVRREYVSAVEVLNECLGEPIGRQDTRYRTREVNNLLKRIDGLEDAGSKRISAYGKQRVYRLAGLWREVEQ